jgi:hypothetical protein
MRDSTCWLRRTGARAGERAGFIHVARQVIEISSSDGDAFRLPRQFVYAEHSNTRSTSCRIAIRLVSRRAQCLFPHLLSGTLLRQSLFHPALRARLQIVGVALDLLDDVFRLNLALETTEGAFD